MTMPPFTFGSVPLESTGGLSSLGATFSFSASATAPACKGASRAGVTVRGRAGATKAVARLGSKTGINLIVFHAALGVAATARSWQLSRRVTRLCYVALRRTADSALSKEPRGAASSPH